MPNRVLVQAATKKLFKKSSQSLHSPSCPSILEGCEVQNLPGLRPWARFAREDLGFDVSSAERDRHGMLRAAQTSSNPSTTGFTLTELLTATAITGIAISLAGAAVMNMIYASKRAEAQEERYTQLNRALNFIVDDLKEAVSVSLTAPADWSDPSGSNYSPSFYLQKPGETVAYYTRSSDGTNWQGPQVIYRFYPSETSGNPVGQALVDAIASTAPTCLGSGDQSTAEVGLKVFIENNQRVTVCLLGAEDGSETSPFETQVFLRSSSGSPSTTTTETASTAEVVGTDVEDTDVEDIDTDVEEADTTDS